MAHLHAEDYEGKFKIRLDNFLADRTNRPFAIGNTIRIPTGWMKDKPAFESRARMAHELVHLDQQGFSSFCILGPDGMLQRLQYEYQCAVRQDEEHAHEEVPWSVYR